MCVCVTHPLRRIRLKPVPRCTACSTAALQPSICIHVEISGIHPLRAAHLPCGPRRPGRRAVCFLRVGPMQPLKAPALVNHGCRFGRVDRQRSGERSWRWLVITAKCSDGITRSTSFAVSASVRIQEGRKQFSRYGGVGEGVSHNCSLTAPPWLASYMQSIAHAL